jgi:hypothetical protein
MARLLADGGAVVWGMSALKYRWEGMSIGGAWVHESCPR